ncbi:hypothetical protein HYX13_01300 [Candidatus Woesearchaeota archaeon]|nr:hypothetical protein [Candidatus Woesearchaeota archaeon]
MNSYLSCNLCTAVNEEYRIVKKTDEAYAIIPLHPLVEGHVMILPKRHALLEELTAKELVELRDLVIILKNKLIDLYPERPPQLITDMNTFHASIPEHFHYHLVPNTYNFRTLLAAHDPAIPRKKEAVRSELEKMAKMLR